MWEGGKGKGGKGGRGGVRVEKVEGLGVGRVVGEKGKEKVGRRVEGGKGARGNVGRVGKGQEWEKEKG